MMTLSEVLPSIVVAIVVALIMHFKASPPPPPPPPAKKDGVSPAELGALARARRSIFPKDFSSDGPEIPKEVVVRALEAANWAPTHGKTEPWRFVIFEGAAGVEKFLAMKRDAIAAQPDVSDEARGAMQAKAAKKEKDLRKCQYIIAICVKRLTNASDKLMPMWEEVAATAMAVQNFHLALWTERAYGYWSSGGYKGWLDVPAVRDALGMGGSVNGESDDVLGFFFVGSAAAEKIQAYRAKRGAIADKLTWYN